MTRRRAVFSQLLASFAILLASPAAQGDEPAAVKGPWEFSPYRVCLAVVAPQDPRWTPRREAAFLRDLPTRVAATVGDDWQLSLTRVPADAAAAADNFLHAGDGESPASELVGLPEVAAAEKLLVLAIAPTFGGWRLDCREFDLAWNRSGPVVSRTIPHSASLAGSAAILAADAFCAQAQVVEGQGGAAAIRVRGRFPASDGAAPIFAVLDASDGADTGFRLEVAEREEGFARCSVAGPDDAELRADGQTAPWRAVRIPDTGAATTIVLAPAEPAGAESVSLAGFAVLLSNGQGNEPLFVGRTNVRGECRLPAGIRGLRQVSIAHAGLAIATFPLVVGEVARRVTPLAATAEMLANAEACQALETSLFDLATARSVLAARIRAAIQGARLDDARKLLAELRTLPAAAAMAARIAEEIARIPTASNFATRRLRQRFDTLEKVAKKQLDAALVDTLAKEVGPP
jgi:hypothetical protein